MTFFYVALIVVVVIFALAYSAKKNKTDEPAQTKPSDVAPKKDSIDHLIKNAGDLMARAQALIQAGIVGDHFAVDAINQGTYNGPLPERRANGGWLSIYDNLRILNIAGINFCKGLDQYVGRVEGLLVPEPENPHDPYAIKVTADDGHHLGYIPSEYTDFVRSLAANEFPYKCTSFIDEREDELDGHKFFVGFVYIKRLD